MWTSQACQPHKNNTSHTQQGPPALLRLFRDTHTHTHRHTHITLPSPAKPTCFVTAVEGHRWGVSRWQHVWAPQGYQTHTHKHTHTSPYPPQQNPPALLRPLRETGVGISRWQHVWAPQACLMRLQHTAPAAPPHFVAAAPGAVQLVPRLVAQAAWGKRGGRNSSSLILSRAYARALSVATSGAVQLPPKLVAQVTVKYKGTFLKQVTFLMGFWWVSDGFMTGLWWVLVLGAARPAQRSCIGLARTIYVYTVYIR